MAPGVVDEVLKLAAARPHLEVCGLLSGSDGKITGHVNFPGPLFPDRFRLPDEWLLRHCLQAHQQGLQVLGYYHSHPNGDLNLSANDHEGHPPDSLVLLVCPQGNWQLRKTNRAYQGFKE